MSVKKHAVLSASASHRWLNCNPSARLELEFEDRESEAAAEGGPRKKLCKQYLTNLDKAKITGISLT